MGLCACPRCLTPKSLFGSLGLANDMQSRMQNMRIYVTTKVLEAREFIYKRGNTVDGSKVEDTLGEGSWVPTLVSTYRSFRFLMGSNKLCAELICTETWNVQP